MNVYFREDSYCLGQGFDEPTVRTALRVAFGNAERAAALLFDPA